MSAITLEERQIRRTLLDLVRRERCSLRSLSVMLGRNPAYLSQFIERGSPRRLEEDDRRKLAEFFSVPESDLGGPAAGRAATVVPASPSGPEREDLVRIPRLPLDASAGPGAIWAEEIPYDSFGFSRRWMREMGLEGAALSAIRVEGDSMEPVLRSGDDIFIDRNKRSGEGIFVIRIGDALHVKQVQASAAGTIVLVSANDHYPPLELPREEVEVIGRVVWKGGRL